MSDSNPPSADDNLQLVIGLGHAGDQVFDLRVTPEYADELQAALEAENVYDGRILEFSAGSELAILAASFGGGLTGLAAALTAFFHRHRHKSISLTHNGEPINITGMSEKKSAELLDRILSEARERQLKNDEEWRRVLRDQNIEPPE